MAQDVTCKVNNCTHYCSGDCCDAAVIEVSADQKNCGCAAETNCKTFRAK